MRIAECKNDLKSEIRIPKSEFVIRYTYLNLHLLQNLLTFLGHI